MKESIHVKNFGPLKDVFIEDIKPFTVLIGESGSGKSLLMKVIALFRWIYKKYNVRSYLKHSDVSKSPFRFRMEMLFRENGLAEFISSKTEIEYEVSFNTPASEPDLYPPQKRSYTILFKDDKLNVPKDIIAAEDLYFHKINFTSETRNLIPLWADKGAETGVSLGFYFNEIYRDFKVATNSIKELHLPFLGVKFREEKTPNSGSKFFLSPLSKDSQIAYQIELKNGSSGMQNAVPLILIAEYFSKKFNVQEAFKRTVMDILLDPGSLLKFTPKMDMGWINKKIYIHIEEPELSLFPDAQCELLNELIRRCFYESENKIELFIATHSPYILNHLNLLIAAHDAQNKTETKGASLDYDQLAVYQVENGCLRDIKAQNERLINTNLLSDAINDIYNAYGRLCAIKR